MATAHDIATLLAAVTAGALGVAALFASWRNPPRPGKWLVACGWLLVALSFYRCCHRAAGAEFGPVIAALLLSLNAWVFVLANRHVRRDNGRRQQPRAVHLPRFRAMVRHAGIFLLAVPLAACCSTLLVLATAWLLPWEDVNRIAFVILALPVAWGVLAYWACTDSRPSRPAIGLMAGAAVSAAFLYI